MEHSVLKTIETSDRKLVMPPPPCALHMCQVDASCKVKMLTKSYVCPRCDLVFCRARCM